MARRPTTVVRIDQDIYDFMVEYAASQEDYVSASQMINRLLRQAVRAAGIAIVKTDGK